MPKYIIVPSNRLRLGKTFHAAGVPSEEVELEEAHAERLSKKHKVYTPGKFEELKKAEAALAKAKEDAERVAQQQFEEAQKKLESSSKAKSK